MFRNEGVLGNVDQELRFLGRGGRGGGEDGWEGRREGNLIRM